MIGLIVATHGNTGLELVRSAEMFSGPLDHCKTWALNPGDDIEDGEKILEKHIDQLDEGDGGLIMTDLRKNVGILTGVNLPMLIQFVSERETQTLDQLVKECMETGQNGILSPTQAMKERRYADGRY